MVGLLGANGAGKTTTLLTLAGELPLLSGEVLLDGTPTKAPLHRRARQGLTFVTEEKSVFMGLTARDNLRVAGVDIADGPRACSPSWNGCSACGPACCRAASSRC